jgi:hypothetical protein
MTAHPRDKHCRSRNPTRVEHYSKSTVSQRTGVWIAALNAFLVQVNVSRMLPLTYTCKYIRPNATCHEGSRRGSALVLRHKYTDTPKHSKQDHTTCRMVGTVHSIQDYLPSRISAGQYGSHQASTVLTHRSTKTGPYYLPYGQCNTAHIRSSTTCRRGPRRGDATA